MSVVVWRDVRPRTVSLGHPTGDTVAMEITVGSPVNAGRCAMLGTPTSRRLASTAVPNTERGGHDSASTADEKESVAVPHCEARIMAGGLSLLVRDMETSLVAARRAVPTVMALACAFEDGVPTCGTLTAFTPHMSEA